jgi:ribosomal protein S18 acetylase RimI-like enzyme
MQPGTAFGNRQGIVAIVFSSRMRKGTMVDTIKELGELAVATRLKRLGERLQRDVSRIYKDLDIDFEARWFSILNALRRRQSMTVTALAEDLRMTHPAINQLAAEMISEKLILSRKSRQDERKRLLRLSARGRKVAAALEPVWESIRLSTRQLIDDSGGGLISALDRIEERLDDHDMYERVMSRIDPQRLLAFDIVDYSPAMKKHFKALNAEWLREHFTIEKEDARVLDDPNGRIIRRGGAILFARRKDAVVGTCALLRKRDGVFELAKLGVAAGERRNGVGEALVRAVIERARAMGASALYLQTSPELKAANRLYRKLGFKKTAQSPLKPERYRRCTIVMKLDLARAAR